MPTAQVIKKKRFKVFIMFLPNHRGEQYELAEATLTVKATTLRKAEELGHTWAKEDWKHYTLSAKEI